MVPLPFMSLNVSFINWHEVCMQLSEYINSGCNCGKDHLVQLLRKNPLLKETRELVQGHLKVEVPVIKRHMTSLP